MSVCLRPNGIREDVHHDGDAGEEKGWSVCAPAPEVLLMCIVFKFWRLISTAETSATLQIRKVWSCISATLHVICQVHTSLSSLCVLCVCAVRTLLA